jgi:hypothetical protein
MRFESFVKQLAASVRESTIRRLEWLLAQRHRDHSSSTPKHA